MSGVAYPLGQGRIGIRLAAGLIPPTGGAGHLATFTLPESVGAGSLIVVAQHDANDPTWTSLAGSINTTPRDHTVLTWLVEQKPWRTTAHQDANGLVYVDEIELLPSAPAPPHLSEATPSVPPTDDSVPPWWEIIGGEDPTTTKEVAPDPHIELRRAAQTLANQTRSAFGFHPARLGTLAALICAATARDRNGHGFDGIESVLKSCSIDKLSIASSRAEIDPTLPHEHLGLVDVITDNLTGYLDRPLELPGPAGYATPRLHLVGQLGHALDATVSMLADYNALPDQWSELSISKHEPLELFVEPLVAHHKDVYIFEVRFRDVFDPSRGLSTMADVQSAMESFGVESEISSKTLLVTRLRWLDLDLLGPLTREESRRADRELDWALRVNGLA